MEPLGVFGFEYRCAHSSVRCKSAFTQSEHPSDHREEGSFDLTKQKYIARKQMAGNDTDSKTIPVLPPPEVESETPPIPQSARSKWADRLKITAFIVAMMSVGLGIGIGLPMLATPSILDVCWILFMTYQTGTLVRSVSPAISNSLIAVLTLHQAINTALPDPRVMDVHRTAWNSITWTITGPNPDSPVPNTKARLTASAILTALCISGVYTGTTWLMCIPVCAFLYDTVSCFAIPDRKFKNMLKWVVYLQVSDQHLLQSAWLYEISPISQVGLSGIVLGVIGISALYKRYVSTESDDTKPSKFSQPSSEVLALMTMFQKSIPLIAPGIFVSHRLNLSVLMCWRYTDTLRSPWDYDSIMLKLASQRYWYPLLAQRGIHTISRSPHSQAQSSKRG